MSLITAGCTIAYSIDTIVIAAGVTFLITLLVSLFSCWTSVSSRSSVEYAPS